MEVSLLLKYFKFLLLGLFLLVSGCFQIFPCDLAFSEYSRRINIKRTIDKGSGLYERVDILGVPNYQKGIKIRLYG